MCYEYWRNEQQRGEEAKARKRAQEMIEKARNSKPVPPQEQPASAEQEQETVPA
jgi:hypothetical protein